MHLRTKHIINLRFFFKFTWHHLPKLGQYSVFSLRTLFFAEHSQSPFLICRVDLVLFTDTDGFHSPMPGKHKRGWLWCIRADQGSVMKHLSLKKDCQRIPASTHNIANRFIVCYFIRSEANFSSAWNSFPFSHIGSHCSTFSGQQSFPKVFCWKTPLRSQYGTNNTLFIRWWWLWSFERLPLGNWSKKQILLRNVKSNLIEDFLRGL